MLAPLQELEMHLSGTRALHFVPRLGQRNGRWALRIDPRTPHQMRRQPFKQRRKGILPEGRIEENHVEAFTRAREPFRRIGPNDADLRRAKRSPGPLERRKRDAVLLHHQHARRTARGGLETQHAATSVEIETSEPIEILPKPVEQRFSNAIGRRAQIGDRGHGDLAAAPCPADDAHAPGRLAA